MSARVSQITGVSFVCSTACSGADQRKHQSSVSVAFVRGIHRSPLDSPHKGKRAKPFHLMTSSWKCMIHISFGKSTLHLRNTITLRQSSFHSFFNELFIWMTDAYKRITAVNKWHFSSSNIKNLVCIKNGSRTRYTLEHATRSGMWSTEMPWSLWGTEG